MAVRGRQREPPNLASAHPPVLPSSRPPCEKISIARGGLVSPHKLLRLGLQIGSPRMFESLDAAFLRKLPSRRVLCTGEGFGASSRE